MTFSIVACDFDCEPPEWGVAVASKFPAVGAVVPWGRAGAGALATQAFANVAYGPRGLELLSKGLSAQEVVSRLTGADERAPERQLGIVDSSGGAATFTGERCLSWAGGLAGEGYCCQGNILVSPGVVEAMSEAFTSSPGELARRLLAALSAGEAAGGDRRGRQSAALLVVRAGGAYGGGGDRAVDLRVDDHPEPVAELARLLDVHRLVFPRPENLRFVEIDDALAEELRTQLRARGYDCPEGRGYDPGLRRALERFVATENLEERWDEGPRVEAAVLELLRSPAR